MKLKDIKACDVLPWIPGVNLIYMIAENRRMLRHEQDLKARWDVQAQEFEGIEGTIRGLEAQRDAAAREGNTELAQQYTALIDAYALEKFDYYLGKQ